MDLFGTTKGARTPSTARRKRKKHFIILRFWLCVNTHSIRREIILFFRHRAANLLAFYCCYSIRAPEKLQFYANVVSFIALQSMQCRSMHSELVRFGLRYLLTFAQMPTASPHLKALTHSHSHCSPMQINYIFLISLSKKWMPILMVNIGNFSQTGRRTWIDTTAAATTCLRISATRKIMTKTMYNIIN